MDHIGIDVHKRGRQIYTLAEGGELSEQRSAPSLSGLASCLAGGPARGSCRGFDRSAQGFVKRVGRRAWGWT